MIEEIRPSNDPISSLAEALRQHLEYPVEDLPAILPHLLNLSVHGKGSAKSLLPISIIHIFNKEIFDDVMKGSGLPNLGVDSMSPGNSVNVIAQSLQTWDQLKALGKLFQIESEMCRFIFTQMAQQGKIDWTDFTVADQEFLGFLPAEANNLRDHGFVFVTFSPRISAAIADLNLEPMDFIEEGEAA